MSNPTDRERVERLAAICGGAALAADNPFDKTLYEDAATTLRALVEERDILHGKLVENARRERDSAEELIAAQQERVALIERQQEALAAHERTIAALREEIKGHEAFARGVNEALNSGDGRYWP